MIEVAPMQAAIKQANPTLIGQVSAEPKGGCLVFSLYEHPLYGDEAPLLVKWGKFYYTTPYWELSDVEPDILEAHLGGAY